MNNKGYLLVEIIVASVLAMTIMYFLVELTINLKNINDDYYVETKLETDQILMVENVMNDLSSYNLKKIAVDSNTVNFTFNDGTNDINKRITIEENKFKYGTINEDSYIDNDIYVKSFDEKLNIEDIKIENLCYVDNSYVDCSSAPNATKGLLKITIPAFTIYSDINYGISLNIPYNVKEVSIYIPKEPIISSKGNNFKITKGENHNIIDEYFTYSTNGGKEITSKKCLINNTDEVTNTSELDTGSYNISCTVTNGDNLSASASTTLTVESSNYFVYTDARFTSNGNKTYIYSCNADTCINKDNCPCNEMSSNFLYYRNGYVGFTLDSYTAMNNKYLYYVYFQNNYSNYSGNIYRCNIDGTDCENIINSFSLANTNSELSPLILANDDHLYYTSYYTYGDSYGFYVNICDPDGTNCTRAGGNEHPLILKGLKTITETPFSTTGGSIKPRMTSNSKYLYLSSYYTNMYMTIYICDLDGTNCHVLGNNDNYNTAKVLQGMSANHFEPEIVATDNYFYYTSYVGGSNGYRMGIYRCDIDGTNCSQIKTTKVGRGTTYGGSFNTQIAANSTNFYYTNFYSSYNNGMDMEVYVCDNKGENCNQMATANVCAVEGHSSLNPRLMANDYGVYYTSCYSPYNGGTYMNIYKCNIDGTNCQNIKQPSANCTFDSCGTSGTSTYCSNVAFGKLNPYITISR